MVELGALNSLSPDFNYDVELDGVNVNLRFKWNATCEVWVLNTYTEIDNEIYFGGILVKPYYNLLESLKTEEYSCSLQGGIYLFSTTPNEPMTYTNLGSIWRIYYLTESERLEWESDNGFQ